MDTLHYDLCVIGGGINGVGIARDAVGRGLTVLLVEAQDLGGATSSASSKLIHGGLRYLENYEFSMVHKALKEREVLKSIAPQLIKPISCVLPVQEAEGARPLWTLKAGMWLYDHLGGKKSLPKSTFIKDQSNPYLKELKEQYHQAFVYPDCWGDDSRLVVLNAVDAAARGARILNYTKCTSLECLGQSWRIGLEDTKTSEQLHVSATQVVNATGPWVSQFLESVGIGHDDPDLPHIRHVKGSHLVLPRLFEGDQTYVLQQDDGRIVFVAPYEGDYTLVGTTDEEYSGDPREAMISDAEMTYLIRAVNDGFEKQITKDDVIFTLSGVRPLVDDGQGSASKVTRDYVLYEHKRFEAPLISVFGGKLTTYRALAQDVVSRLMRISANYIAPWTHKVPLAGGDFSGSVERYIEEQARAYPFLPSELVERYVRSYGARMDYFLHMAQDLSDLGADFGDGVYRAEIDYLRDYEWARNVEDVIWRRSKLGLKVSEQTINNIDQYLRSGQVSSVESDRESTEGASSPSNNEASPVMEEGK